MVDGSAYLSSFLLSSRKIGIWTGTVEGAQPPWLTVHPQSEGIHKYRLQSFLCCHSNRIPAFFIG